MKKKTYLLFLGLTLSSINFAQQFQFGIKAGVNIGYIDGKSGDDVYGLINLHTGIYVAHDFNQTIGVQLEALVNTLNNSL